MKSKNVVDVQAKYAERANICVMILMENIFYWYKISTVTAKQNKREDNGNLRYVARSQPTDM